MKISDLRKMSKIELVNISYRLYFKLQEMTSQHLDYKLLRSKEHIIKRNFNKYLREELYNYIKDMQLEILKHLKGDMYE